MKKIRPIITFSFILLATAAATAQTPVSMAFTYQGQLKENGSPANGSYSLTFALWDAASGGSQIGDLRQRANDARE